MKPRLVRSPLARYLSVAAKSVAALPLITGALLAGLAVPAGAAEEPADGPRYSYFDAGYQWTDVNYAVKQDGGQHTGVVLRGSVDLIKLGPVGFNVFGEYFDGEFSGVSTICDDGEGGDRDFDPSRDDQSMVGGLGAHYRFLEKTDLAVQVAYVDYSEFQVPTDTCGLVSTDDDGYTAEALIRSELSENVEIEAGFRYTDLNDADVSNNDVLLGLGYHVTDYLSLRASGIVFDSDAGFELSARLYFGSFLGRDTMF